MTDESLYAPSLVEMATRRLREEILSARLVPGERLIEEQIRRRYSISRAPLREALRLLAQQGLVEHLPRRGFRVTEWSDTDILELFAIRSVLEQHAIMSAFPLPSNVKEQRLDLVRDRLEQMRVAGQAEDQLGKDDAHRAFHAAIVAMAGNRQLDLAIEPVLIKLQRPMAVNLRREALLLGPEEGLRRHRQLLAAVESNDPKVILLALEQHGTRRYLQREASAG